MSFLSAVPLNLNLIEVLIHLVNLTILILVVRFLLYKPIKKFMVKRSEEFKKQSDEREQKLSEANQLKDDYEKLLAQTKQDVLQITENTAKSAQLQAGEIIGEAKQKAAQIIKQADAEIQQKNKEEIGKIKSSISNLAYAMASEVLNREIGKKDIDKDVDKIIGEWNNH